MPALFPSWSDDLLRVALVAFGGGIIGVPTLLIVLIRAPSCTEDQRQVIQPVLFDHRHHVRDDGIDCLYCHDTAEKGPRASVPATSVCMGCHAQIWIDSKLLAPVRESFERKKPIPWVRVYDAPDFVFFNHEAHTRRGVGCVECHGRVDLMAQVVMVNPVIMNWCLDCHRHPEGHLRPLDRITDMEWQADPATEAQLVRELKPHPTTDCVGCHR